MTHKDGVINPKKARWKRGGGEVVAVNQENRQAGFESLKTTDDHLMHITGLSKDQDGTSYYKTKNSWGTDRGASEGYLYMSESYMRLHTVAIMVHKDAFPKAIKKKLGIK